MLFCCSSWAKATYFHALVLPLIQYAFPVWLPHYHKDLQSVQHRAARWVCGSRFVLSTFTWSPPTSSCMSTLGWPSINTRLTTSSLLFLHDIIKKHSSIPFHNYFQFNFSRTRSHPHTLLTKSSVLNSYHFSFFVNIAFYGTV